MSMSPKKKTQKRIFSSILVGLSNILDSELIWGEPTEEPHRQVVGAAVVDGKLFFKISKRIKRMAGVEPLLVFSMTALNFAIMPWRVRTDQLVAYAKLHGQEKVKQKMPRKFNNIFCAILCI